MTRKAPDAHTRLQSKAQATGHAGMPRAGARRPDCTSIGGFDGSDDVVPPPGVSVFGTAAALHTSRLLVSYGPLAGASPKEQKSATSLVRCRKNAYLLAPDS